MKKNCETSQKFYKEISTNTVELIYLLQKPIYYEKLSISMFEYIGNMFKRESQLNEDEILDYMKIEARIGDIKYIRELGKKYIYGHGLKQNFEYAKFYFEEGAKYGDPTCLFYLGEIYLNGWGVNKVLLYIYLGLF